MNEQINALVVGSGGREHALAWSLARSWRVKQVYVAPGNAGTQWQGAPCIEGFRPFVGSQNVDIAAEDINALVQFSVKNDIGLAVIGPEVPLSLGLVDALNDAGIKTFGPTRAAAQIEASKAFAKQFMRDHDIPTAEYAAFSDYDSAVRYLEEFNRPVVVKADGLAAGKGVIVCDDLVSAKAALKEILVDGAFGTAGTQVIIEERLTGPELSVLAFSDGKHVAVMPPTRDHKRAFDGDEGPNTGGMGAYSPVPDVTPELIDTIKRTVLEPTIAGLAAQGTPYVGVLYAGLMLTPDGAKTLEFNCRFGDPETQVILPLLETDLPRVLMACVDGTLDTLEIEWSDEACATVVLASPGYPASYPKGLPISGVDKVQDAIVFHAGTARENGQLVTNGGRVLAVSALGADMDAALQNAYRELKRISFEGAHYRTDIGQLT